MWGDLVQNRPQNPTPEVSFPLLERVDLRSQKEGILGKKIGWGRVGWTWQKKEKRMRKKKWAIYKKIIKLISKRFRFGNFSTEIIGEGQLKGDANKGMAKILSYFVLHSALRDVHVKRSGNLPGTHALMPFTVTPRGSSASCQR